MNVTKGAALAESYHTCFAYTSFSCRKVFKWKVPHETLVSASARQSRK